MTKNPCVKRLFSFELKHFLNPIRLIFGTLFLMLGSAGVTIVKGSYIPHAGTLAIPALIFIVCGAGLLLTPK